MTNTKRVLVAPLDWGLGHATRCIPIIDALLKRGCNVSIASSGHALQLLRKEFPVLHSFEIVSYRATYPKSIPLMVAVFLQLPKFLLAIRKEHNQIKRIVQENNIDLIISDNRFGCWTTQIPSVFISHQLTIRMPFLLKLLQPIIQYFNHWFIKKYNQCWVPDIEGDNNISGELSQSKSVPHTRVGLLSRFSNGNTPAGQKYDIAVVLSGPEPQRSILEEIILPQLKRTNQKTMLVRGVVESDKIQRQDGNLCTVNFLESNELRNVIEQSNLIISRAGYSTIMDLAVLHKKAILIPTPGQTEQEYLAKRLSSRKICFTMRQKEFDLNYAMDQSKSFTGFSNIESANALLDKALDEVLSL